MLLFVSDGRAAAHVKVGVIGAKDLHSLQEGGFLILQIRFFPGVQLGDLGLYVLQLLSSRRISSVGVPVYWSGRMILSNCRDENAASIRSDTGTGDKIDQCHIVVGLMALIKDRILRGFRKRPPAGNRAPLRLLPNRYLM